MTYKLITKCYKLSSLLESNAITKGPTIVIRARDPNCIINYSDLCITVFEITNSFYKIYRKLKNNLTF